jgi:hypothetical protein
MRLFDYCYYNDFGDEMFLQILAAYPKFALIDAKVRWDDFPSTEWFPSILFGLGPKDVFGFSIRYKKFVISMSFFNFDPRNIEMYRRAKEND